MYSRYLFHDYTLLFALLFSAFIPPTAPSPACAPLIYTPPPLLPYTFRVPTYTASTSTVPTSTTGRLQQPAHSPHLVLSLIGHLGAHASIPTFYLTAFTTLTSAPPAIPIRTSSTHSSTTQFHSPLIGIQAHTLLSQPPLHSPLRHPPLRIHLFISVFSSHPHCSLHTRTLEKLRDKPVLSNMKHHQMDTVR